MLSYKKVPHLFLCYNIKLEDVYNIQIPLIIPERKLQHIYLNTIRFCKNK